MLFGRSMGSGPTSYLSSIREPYALLLMSPYTSIQNAAKSILGWASFIGFIVYEKFNNLEAIKNAKCPVFIVHGKEDKLIPVSHSEELYEACPSETYFHMPSAMDHNEFQLTSDLIEPIKRFMRKIEKKKNLVSAPPKEEEKKVEEEKKGPDEEEEVNLFKDIWNGITGSSKQKDSFEALNDSDLSDQEGPSSNISKLEDSMENPYLVDEVDRKRKKEYEVKFKNFDKKLDKPLKKSYSDENMFETFTKDLMKKVDNPYYKAPVQVHYETKTGNFNMITHCSRVDESFVDYLGEQEIEMNTQRYANVLKNLAKGQKPEKEKKEIKPDEKVKYNNFVVYFDQSLFEAPPIVVKLEEELANNENEGAYKK